MAKKKVLKKEKVAEDVLVTETKEAPKPEQAPEVLYFAVSPRVKKLVVSVQDVVVPAGPRKRVVTEDRLTYVLNEEEFTACVTK